jgi:putative membrane protein insertion efficiency factor
MKRAVIGMLRLYKTGISPYIGRCCRYEPTCSSYAIEAVSEYGTLKGLSLALKRVLRCHPFAKGGYDPVKKGKK